MKEHKRETNEDHNIPVFLPGVLARELGHARVRRDGPGATVCGRLDALARRRLRGTPAARLLRRDARVHTEHINNDKIKQVYSATFCGFCLSLSVVSRENTPLHRDSARQLKSPPIMKILTVTSNFDIDSDVTLVREFLSFDFCKQNIVGSGLLIM